MMSTITELSQTLKGWLRWMRLQRALTWSLHGLVTGLALAVVVGLVGLFQASLLRSEFLTLVVGLALIAMLLAGSIAYLWPISHLKAARHFDLVFHLNERISTAVELNRGERSPSRLVQQQLDDAVISAQKVKPVRDLPLRFRAVEGSLALILLLLNGWVWFRGEAWFHAAQQSRAVQQAVNGQERSIEKILAQIQTNNNLTEEQKHALSQPLEQAMSDLQNNTTLEGSVSVLTSTGDKLQALSESQTQQTSQALQEAGQQLARQEGSPLQSMGQNLAEGDTIKAASQLSQTNLNNLSPTATEQLANQLNEMSQSLASTQPELASQLNQAVQALHAGDISSTREALNQTAKSFSQVAQQATFSQTASQAGQQMKQGAAQVSAAGGSQQMAQGQLSNQSQPGNNQSGQMNGAGGSGSGHGETQSSQAGGGKAGNTPIQQNNGQGDGGVTSYEQIYAPTLLGGNGGPIVKLPGSAQGGSVIGQTPANPTDSGQSLVPYNEVLSQYEQVNQKSIDSGSIPFQFTEIIRSYFDSLKP